VEATCTKEGSYDEVVYCSVCETHEISRETKTIAKADHTEEVVPGKAATCTETGLTEGKKCSVCGEVLVEQEEIAATGKHAWDEGVVTKEPTATEEGVMTYTCGTCGETKTEEIPAMDEPTVLEASLRELTVSFDAEVLLKFGFQMPDELVHDENAYAEYDIGVSTYTISMAEIRALGKSKAGYYIVSVGIPAAYMTYDATVRIIDGAGNLVQLTDYKDADFSGTEVSRCVLDYADAVLASDAMPEKVKTAVSALLTYGGYAQLYFGKDVENPAYNLLSQYNRNIPTLEDIDEDTITQELVLTGNTNNGLTYKQQKVNLGSAIYLRNMFELSTGEDISNFTFTVKTPTGNKDLEATYLPNEGLYCVDILRIAAAYWDYTYELTVTNIKTGESYTLYTSVLAWLDRNLDAYKGITTGKVPQLVNLVKAMYYYNQAANVYFGK